MNRENSVHVVIVLFRETLVIESQVKMRCDRIFTRDVAPFTVPVPLGNHGDGIGGGR